MAKARTPYDPGADKVLFEAGSFPVADNQTLDVAVRKYGEGAAKLSISVVTTLKSGQTRSKSVRLPITEEILGSIVQSCKALRAELHAQRVLVG